MGGMKPCAVIDLEGAQQIIDVAQKAVAQPPEPFLFTTMKQASLEEVYADDYGVVDGTKKRVSYLPSYDLEFFRVDT